MRPACGHREVAATRAGRPPHHSSFGGERRPRRSARGPGSLRRRRPPLASGILRLTPATRSTTATPTETTAEGTSDDGSRGEDGTGSLQPRLRRRLPAARHRRWRPRGAPREQPRGGPVPQGLRARVPGVAAAAGAGPADAPAGAHGAARVGAVPRGDVARGRAAGHRRPRERAREARRRLDPGAGRVGLVSRRAPRHRGRHRPLPQPQRRARGADVHLQLGGLLVHAAGGPRHPVCRRRSRDPAPLRR